MRNTRYLEGMIARLFSVRKAFSEHLSKWEDDSLPDKYDHNFFEYSAQPDPEEFRQALEYQKNRKDAFIKLEGYTALADSFGLEASVTLTMIFNGEVNLLRRRDGLEFAEPCLNELVELELKNFGAEYGDDFTVRNIKRLYGKLDYHGAYIGARLVASCYSFSGGGLCCVDGLAVDKDFRMRGIGSALLSDIIERSENETVFLHADEDDTPKDIYAKMGFVICDRLYEYSCTDITGRAG